MHLYGFTIAPFCFWFPVGQFKAGTYLTWEYGYVEHGVSYRDVVANIDKDELK